MECSEFMNICKNFHPRDIAQVERIAMICHMENCPDCNQFIVDQLQENGVVDEPEVKMLAEMDRRVVWLP